MGSVIQIFSVLFNWSRGVKHSHAMIAFATAAGAVAGLGSTALIAVINRCLGQTGPTRGLGWDFVALCVIIPLAGFASQALLTALTAKAARDLRFRLAQQVLAAPYRLTEELGVPKLMATITDDIPSVTAAITSLPVLCTQIAIVIGCLVYLGWLSWPLLLVVVVYLVVGLLSYQIPIARSVQYFRKMRDAWDATFHAIRDLTEGTKELKLHRSRRSAFLSEQLEPAIDDVQNYGIKANTFAVAAANWGQMLFFIFIGVILFITPRFIIVDHQVLTGYTLTVLFMTAPLSIVLNTLPVLEKAHVAADKVKKLGLSLSSRSPEVSTRALATPAARDWKWLELDGVTHTYRTDGESSEFLLGPLNLTFLPGELVFLVGGNGSGKTTLAKILMGLYEPEEGVVRLDTRPVTHDTIDDYRQNFSVVFYDFYLFERLLGLAGEDLLTNADRYLKRLQLSDKLYLEGNKLSTVALSQGQRKRLALLTAYLEDRPIYIFDEWASDQDPSFKQIFYCDILPELKANGKTIIVISHDDRYYHLADRIIKLERGKVEYDRRAYQAIEVNA